MLNSDNTYLSGNYAPWREEGDAFDLQVDGEIPRELNGALYRIGPNPHLTPRGRYHWFDGDGMVHAVMRGSVHYEFENSHMLYNFGMHPELIEEADALHGEDHDGLKTG